MVFSACKSVEMPDGSWVSNPTEEMIAEAGWQVYVPPVVPPQPQTEPDYTQVMEAVKKILSTEASALTDEEALEVAALFPTWKSKIGSTVTVGERLWYNEKLYKVVQEHTPQDEWTPDITPALYTEVSIEEVPEWKQPTGAQDAYMAGDKVKHNGFTWESTVDNNTWEPGVYGWNQLNN